MNMNVNQKRRRILQAAGAFVLSPLMPSWSRAEIPVLAGSTMGTRFKVHIHQVPDGLYLPKLKRGIVQVFETTESLMSTYRRESELFLFNVSTSTDWQPISIDTAYVVDAALTIQKQSSGAFTPAGGALVDYWGFGAKPSIVSDVLALPPADVLASVQNTNIELKPGFIRKSFPDTALDLNAIAKGDAIDKVAAVLNRNGIFDFLIEIGGEIRAHGVDPNGNPWLVGLENHVDNVRRRISLHNQAVATSGDYINYFIQDGRRVSHVIDPRTGGPIEHGLVLVNVVADNAMQADAWATALLVMGLEEGYLYAQQNAIAASFLQRDGAGYHYSATADFNQLGVMGMERSV